VDDFRFELREEPFNGEVRLIVDGELDLGTVEDLERRLTELREGGQAVLLDLTPLSFMDSSGLRALMLAREEADRSGSGLRIVPPRGDAREVLRISGVEPFLPLVEEVDL
jgi:stage II sporulation protein AA (anti-sigma F factor antagonist)